jgi:DNA-directed RNA polymerase subunit RPC12/RpoP
MKKFIKNNQSFECVNCKKQVEAHPKSSRDHCTHCLYGLHVDINPGDRANTCKGLLKPIGVNLKNKKEQIIYLCTKCEKQVGCITAPDDNREEILNLYKHVF